MLTESLKSLKRPSRERRDETNLESYSHHTDGSDDCTSELIECDQSLAFRESITARVSGAGGGD